MPPCVAGSGAGGEMKGAGVRAAASSGSRAVPFFLATRGGVGRAVAASSSVSVSVVPHRSPGRPVHPSAFSSGSGGSSATMGFLADRGGSARSRRVENRGKGGASSGGASWSPAVTTGSTGPGWSGACAVVDASLSDTSVSAVRASVTSGTGGSIREKRPACTSAAKGASGAALAAGGASGTAVAGAASARGSAASGWVVSAGAVASVTVSVVVSVTVSAIVSAVTGRSAGQRIRMAWVSRSSLSPGRISAAASGVRPKKGSPGKVSAGGMAT